MTKPSLLLLPLLFALSVPAHAAGLDLPVKPGPAANYWDQFPATKAAKWSDPNFFPILVWQQALIDPSTVAADRKFGFNTYYHLQGGSDLTLARSGGMFAILPGPAKNSGAETVGWFIEDEADMLYGPGKDQWSGKDGWNTCIPIQDKRGSCGYTVVATKKARLPDDGHALFANWGKGVGVWHGDPASAAFVNDFTNANTIDLYWYTDSALCLGSQGGRLRKGTGPAKPIADGGDGMTTLSGHECHRASNYGLGIDRLLKLDAKDGKYQPLGAFVEAVPQANGQAIAGPQVQGAVWSTLIHGARLIAYFSHSMNTNGCATYSALRDGKCGGAGTRDFIAESNRQVKDLASCLNGPIYDVSFGAAVLDIRLSPCPDGTYLLLAQQNASDFGTYELKLPKGLASLKSAKLPYESRELPIAGGELTLSFGNEYETRIVKLGPL